jgi:hypothetical protein
MKKYLPAIALLLVVGCTSFYTTAFRTEQLTVSGGHSAVHTWNQYYHAATNNLVDANELAKLNNQHVQVMGEARKFGLCAQVYNSALEDYRVNSADTNKAAVTLAFDIVSDEATNIENLVKFFINPANPTIVTFSTLPTPIAPSPTPTPVTTH